MRNECGWPKFHHMVHLEYLRILLHLAMLWYDMIWWFFPSNWWPVLMNPSHSQVTCAWSWHAPLCHFDVSMWTQNNFYQVGTQKSIILNQLTSPLKMCNIPDAMKSLHWTSIQMRFFVFFFVFFQNFAKFFWRGRGSWPLYANTPSFKLVLVVGLIE